MSEVLNSALEDIKDIVVSRPELTAEQWEIVGKGADWLKSTMRPELRAELEVEYAKREAVFQDELKKETQEMVKQSMENWAAEQKPLDEQELSKLLSQDYIEFTLELRIGRSKEKRHFTISELPGEVEIKFVKSAQKYLVPFMEKMNSMEFRLEASVASQVALMLEQLPEALKVAADLVSTCLDPWGEHPSEDGNWVLKNISVKRIADIITAQSEANRYRDFFLNGSRSYRSLTKR